MPTITTVPETESDAHLLQQLQSMQSDVYAELNTLRWSCFYSKQPIFEKSLSSLPKTSLPNSSQQILLQSNAIDWAVELQNVIASGEISQLQQRPILRETNVAVNESTLSQPIGKFPHLCVKTDDMTQTEDTIIIQTTGDRDVTFTVEDSINISEFSETQVYIYKSGDAYVIEPYNITPETLFPIVHTPERTTYEDIAIAKILSVTTGTKQVVQIEIPKDSILLKNKLETMDVYTEQISQNNSVEIYFVGTPTVGKAKITDFLHSQQTLSNYFNFLGIPPESVSYYASQIQDETVYGRHSLEEIAIYAYINGHITKEELPYILSCQYRPKPTIEGIKNAIQHAKQFQQGDVILQTESINTAEYNAVRTYYTSYIKYLHSLHSIPLTPVSEIPLEQLTIESEAQQKLMKL